MTNYDKKITEFFESVDKHLAKVAACTSDKDILAHIRNNQKNIRAIADGLPKTASQDARDGMGLDINSYGFAERESDADRLFLVFADVIFAIDGYYGCKRSRNFCGTMTNVAKADLLKKIKKWNFAKSVSMLKALIPGIGAQKNITGNARQNQK